jgi:hypothetical protein
MLKKIQRLHRVVGLVSIIVVFFLAATGVLLNHREELTLYDRYPENPLIMWLYGEGEGGEERAGEEFIEEPPTWERVLTAFHAGRFLGMKGNLFVDIAAIILVILVLTGPYIWVRRLILLRMSKEIEDEEALIEKTEKLLMVKDSARGFLKRAGQLHDISEHVLEHIKASPEGTVARDIEEIERHLVELDTRMHGLIKRIEGLEEDVTSE